MLDKPFYPPLFDACERFVHACQLLSTRNVAKHCRATVKVHLFRSGKRLAAEHAGCSNSHGADEGGDAAPCSRRSQGGGGVASGCPYLHTTRPSSRVSCGGSAKRIVAGQACQYGKEGKPVGGRATTITVSHIERERGVHLTLHLLPAAGQAREGRPLWCMSGQAAAARRVVVVGTHPMGGLRHRQRGLQLTDRQTAAAAAGQPQQSMQRMQLRC